MTGAFLAGLVAGYGVAVPVGAIAAGLASSTIIAALAVAVLLN